MKEENCMRQALSAQKVVVNYAASSEIWPYLANEVPQIELDLKLSTSYIPAEINESFRADARQNVQY